MIQRNLSTKVAIAGIVLGLSIGVPTTVLAQKIDKTTNSQSTNASFATQKSAAIQRLTEQISNLNHRLSTLSSNNKLTSDQKNKATTKLQNEISQLTALKIKVNAAMDENTLQADLTTLYGHGNFQKNGRAFGKFNGQQKSIHNFSTKLQDLTQQVNTAKRNGKDISLIQPALNDLQAKVSDLKSQEIKKVNIQKNLNKQQLQPVVQKILSDSNAAKSDITQIQQGLKR